MATDRYSQISEQGIVVDFLDTTNRMKGWKVNFNENDAWIRYNAVDFGKVDITKIIARNIAEREAVLELRADKPDGPLISHLVLNKAGDWKESTFTAKAPRGVHDLYLIMKSPGGVSIDWLRFE